MIGLHNFTDLHSSEFRAKVLKAYEEILKNNAFIEGEFNFEFEEKFAKMQGAKHCLLVANGTDAIEISLQASGVEPGDLVGVPGITFYATAEAVLNVGAKPILIDVDPKTGLICPESTKRVIEKHNLKAIIPVHIYGLPAQMQSIYKIANEHNIIVVEDAAQACGAFINGSPVGAPVSKDQTNNLVTFSFYPTKNLSAFGDAGAILTSCDELAEKIKIIRNHGRGSDGKLMGRNSRCDHMQAVVLALKLDKIEQYNQNRKNAAKKYHELLSGVSEISLLPSEYLNTSAFHLYPVLLKDRETQNRLLLHLQAAKIGCANFYDRSLSQEPAFADCQGEKEVADNFSGRVICLPMHPFLTEEEIKIVSKKIKEFFANS